jgi:hypothetical protein
MPTPEELVAYLHRIITTAEHQDEFPQILSPTLVKDIHLQFGQCVMAMINAQNTLRAFEIGEASHIDAKGAADMISLALKGEL